MTTPNFWAVLDRACNTGAITNVKDFDMKLKLRWGSKSEYLTHRLFD